jgi:hypothetical protein
LRHNNDDRFECDAGYAAQLQYQPLEHGVEALATREAQRQMPVSSVGPLTCGFA